MDLDPEVRRTRARQVGMLMQTYRRAHDVTGRRLSQEGLLRLMGEADPRYLERYDRSTVARWESGEIRPTRERIEVFGEALHLSSIEVEGLISLAGLDLENGNGQDNGPRGSEEKAQAGDALLGDVPPADPLGAAGGDAASYAGEAIRFSLSRFLLPGSCVAGAGYALASLGWGTTWMLMLYVSVAIGLVLVQGFLRLRRANELRELFFLSVFFLLSTPMVQAPLTRMDNYGFYAIGDFAGTPMPYLLALIVNLLLALVAGLMFDFLWKWQYFGGRPERKAYRRAAWVVLPPLAFVYVNLLVFSNVGAWIYLSAVFSVLAGVFITLAALRDEDVSLPDWNRKLLLGGAVAATIVLVAFNGAAILAVYLQPGLLALPDHSLLRSWDIDFGALGYPPEELAQRLGLGFAWASLSTLAYMVILVGGHLIVTIYRLGDGGSAASEASVAPSAGVPFPRRRPPRGPSRLERRAWAYGGLGQEAMRIISYMWR